MTTLPPSSRNSHLAPDEARLLEAAERAKHRGDHWEYGRLRRELLELQARRYARRDPGPAANPAPAASSGAKPLEVELGRLRAKVERQWAVRQAGRRQSLGRIAGSSLGDDQRANEAQFPPGLKVHPSLAMAAMKAKVDRQYRVWVIARSLPDAGSGRVKVRDLAALIEREDVGGLSPGTLRRLLRAGGDGVFWTIFHDASGDKVLYLRGLARVCEALGVERLSYTPLLVAVRWVKSLKGFRAVCYVSMFPCGDEFSNPISRRVIEGLTGKTPRTQRNYDAALAGKLRKRDNAKIVGKPRHGDEIPDGHYLDKVRTRDGDDYLVLLQRLPNSFMVGFERGRRGMMRKVNQRLRYSLQNVGRGKREKLFYRDPVAAQRRIQQQRESDWFCIAGAEVGGRFVSETRGGARLWTGVQKVGGQVFFS